MTTKLSTPDILAIECRHVTHVEANREQDVEDVHLIKEQVHYADGTICPRLTVRKNYKRDFYVTKKGYRNHKQKKDWESIEKLDKYSCTQSQLARAAGKMLDLGYIKDLREIKKSPYLYGVDVESRSVIRKEYYEQYKAIIQSPTRSTVAAFDIETDMVTGDEEDGSEIIIASITFKNRCYTAVLKRFAKDLANPRIEVTAAIEKYIGDVLRKRGITNPILEFVDTPYEIIKKCFQKAHEWKPDFISVWNITFEMERMLEDARLNDYDLSGLLSDPSVPAKYRKLVFKPGKHQKVTASGKFTPVKPHNRWPVIELTASFKMVCSMCTYRHIRLAKQEESSYALDAILEKEVEGSKLKIPEAEAYQAADWHFFMQAKMKAAYIAYNIFDCIALELLDEKTSDLGRGLPTNLDFSDSSLFGSQPSRTVESEHFYTLEHGYVMACASPEMKQPIDALIYPLKGWIVALRAHLVSNNGMRCIIENSNIITNIRSHVADLDAVGAYPHGQWVFNICKASTAKEAIGIDGFDMYTLKMQGINLITAGHTNAIEFCTTMLNAPSLVTLLVAFNAHLGFQSTHAALNYPVERPMISLRSDDDDDEADEESLDPYKKLDAAIEASQDD